MGGELGLAGVSVIGLNSIWYSDYPRTGFHTFNDNGEWLLMDKAGHVMTSYYIGKIGINLLKWTGMQQRKACVYGGFLGTGYLTILELFDGFSSGWGFSWGDMAANLTGSLVVASQELFWKEQRITMKFSFHRTDFPDYRKNILGNSLSEQILKDYNGQTYWLSANISSFIGNENKFPKWLGVALGYGATGMIGGMEKFPGWEGYPSFERYGQFYFSIDADLWRIKTSSKFLRGFFSTFGFIKIPAPALEFSRYGIKAYPLYF